MKEYFISIIAIALVGALIISMLPDATNAKYLRLICGLCAIGCIVLPLANFGSENFDFDEITELFGNEEDKKEQYDKFYNASIKEAEITNAQILLKSEIIQATSASAKDFDVKIYTANIGDEIYISNIEIKIYPSGIFMDVHAATKCVEENFGCKCRIIYDT